jgi:hypothetical protein
LQSQSPSIFSLEVVASRIASAFSNSSDEGAEDDDDDDEEEEEEKEETGEARRNLIEGPSRELASQMSDYHFTGITGPAIGWRHDHLKCSDLR